MVCLIPFLLLAPDPVNIAFSPTGRQILEHADRVTLVKFENYGVDKAGVYFFTGVKSRKVLRSASDRTKAVRSIYDSLRGPSMPMKCFTPHHSLIAEKRGKKVSLLICYSCGWLWTTEMGRVRPHLAFGRAGMAAFESLLK